ncbi:hypothetical protein Cgig2_022311 [Carnegiea gigantea]|uniref:Uncharacterized protein n=1 Tax=Carnegiea gigantea TaxID=171969 RepID=A0A9Q1JKF5_9CARY|nr:hypothetical protein Cgig2_022311 [Carnegiea gigantea]
MEARELKLLMGPAMTFGLKTATAMVHQILVDIGSSIDVTTLECLKKLQCNKRDLAAIKTPICGVRGTSHVSPWKQETTYPSRQQRQLKNHKIKLSGGGHPYSVILGRSSLNAMKVVVTSYLLLIQFELDDRKMGKLYREQKIVRECYYVSLKPLRKKEELPTGETSRPNKTENEGHQKGGNLRKAYAQLGRTTHDH